MAREAQRPYAHLAHETGRAGLVEDRYARNERAAEEDGEKGLAEHGAALQAVAPILADRCAAVTGAAAVRRLIRCHDDEPRARNLVPPWFADQKEAEVVRPRLELKEREFFRGEHFIHRLQEIAGVLESDDLLLIAQAELRLSQVQFFVEPCQVLQRDIQLERTQAQVHVAEKLVRFENLGHAEAEPVGEDAGHSAVRLGSEVGDECGLSAGIGRDAFREDVPGRGDGEAGLDNGGVGLVHRRLDFTRLPRTRRCFRLPVLRFRFLCLGFRGLALLLADWLRLRLFLRLFLVRLLFLPLLGLVLLPEPAVHLTRIPGSLVIRVVLLWSVLAIRPPATALSSWVA